MAPVGRAGELDEPFRDPPVRGQGRELATLPVRVPEPHDDRSEHREHDLRPSAELREEPVRLQDEGLARLRDGDARRVRLAVDRRELPEHLAAGAEPEDRLATVLGVEDAAGDVALGEHDGPGTQALSPAGSEELAEGPAREVERVVRRDRRVGRCHRGSIARRPGLGPAPERPIQVPGGPTKRTRRSRASAQPTTAPGRPPGSPVIGDAPPARSRAKHRSTKSGSASGRQSRSTM